DEEYRSGSRIAETKQVVVRPWRRALGRSHAALWISAPALAKTLCCYWANEPRTTQASLGDRAAAHSSQRNHLQRLWRSTGQRASLGSGSDSSGDRSGRVGAYRTVHHSARGVVESDAGGFVW